MENPFENCNTATVQQNCSTWIRVDHFIDVNKMILTHDATFLRNYKKKSWKTFYVEKNDYICCVKITKDRIHIVLTKIKNDNEERRNYCIVQELRRGCLPH